MAKNANAKPFRVDQSPNFYIYSIQAAAFANLNEVLRPHGITTPGWRVLANLQERDGVSLRELAAQTSIDVSNLSKLIGVLQKRGLVTKRASKEDARVILIKITAAGRRKFHEALPYAREILDLSVVGFTSEEQTQFMDLLRRMKQNVTARS